MLSYRNAPCCHKSSWRMVIAMLPAIAIGGFAAAVVIPQETAQAQSKTSAKADKSKPTAGGKKKKESDIPYDAYFDNPLEIANDNAVLAAPKAAKTEPAEMEKPSTDAPKSSGGGTMAWSEILPADDLQSEVKKIQNQLRGWMQGQGTYNGNYKEISVDGAVIAALAGIALEHNADFPWKKHAPIIRDLGFELSKAATGLGKDNFDRSKAAYEKMDSVFGGAVPNDAPQSAPKRPFSDTAERDGLMKRIEKARNHLRDNINTEAKLKSDADSVLHETVIISALGSVVATEGYVSADEQEYKQFIDALIGGAKDAGAAVKDQSFKKFTDSMNKVNKSCDQCHASYGNG